MAHKTLIDGTAYEISGGKTLVDGTAYAISGGKTLVDGTVYEVGFGGLPNDIDNSLEFTSIDAFSIKVATPRWNGTMEYCNGEDGWQIWDGSEISSYNTGRGHCIYIRGTGNTIITGDFSSDYGWTLKGTSIACNGNIETLLDYASVKAGTHPPMLDYCYSGMFRACSKLTTAPALPATTLAESCYRFMFYSCSNLTTVPALPATTLEKYCYAHMFGYCTKLTTAPALPATTLAESCYNGMFAGCSKLTTVPALPATTLEKYCYAIMFNGCAKIMLSSTQTAAYSQAYRIPSVGTGTTADSALLSMFNSTSGTFKSTPSINTTYYLASSNTIVY